MSKEMVVSANPHETRVAILEDGQVSEVFFERERSYSLAGSIYKGRVTRILPGMQSAFVNIGLERDAFLYVSDFLEGLEEYDQLVNALEERTPSRARQQEEPEVRVVEASSEAVIAEGGAPEAESEIGSSSEEGPVTSVASGESLAANGIEALPGESISAQPRAQQPERTQGDRNSGDRNRDGGRGRDRGRFGGR